MLPQVTRDDIALGLRELGLTTGDTVLLHSSLSSIGQVVGGADAVIDAFLAVVGPTGTLMVPTFGSLGIITEVLRNHPAAVRSIHPKASVAALGAHAEELCRDHWRAELAHGADTPYTRIAELDGKICLLGVDQDRNTILHAVEELARLPYLRTTAPATFETPEGMVTKSWPLFPGPHRDFIGLDARLRQEAGMRVGRIGNAVVRLVSARKILEVGRRAAAHDPAFVLCDNPNCADCRRQRADLRRDRLAKESFRLAAAASLAGRWPEEIAEACALAGIAAVELDCLNGLPTSRLPHAGLERGVARLREDGCTVSSLRFETIPRDPAALAGLAVRLGIGRVVLPLSMAAAKQAAACRESGVAVSFGNGLLDSETATEILLGLDAAGIDAGLSFGPAAFARAGENPFLRSYRRKLHRRMDQLDVEDATFDGTPKPLGQGNAEIKELISILRCRSFSGWFVLSAANRHTGTLADAVARFEDLLDRM